MFVWGRVRGDVVALSALMVLTATGVLTTSEALSGFSSPIVIMMAGLFVVGGAILQTGLAQSAGNSISRMAKGNETRAFIYVVLATSFIGAFVSNTGTVAIMMPIIMSMAASSGIRSSRLLMPVAFAGSLGGMLTLIGTPPNLVISETLEEHGFAPLGFFTFLPIGLIVIALGLNGWFSTNILGNRDGLVLDEPANFHTKEVSKLSTLETILKPEDQPDLYGHGNDEDTQYYHKVRINYYPPRNDNKEGWDNIDIFGWMGYPMQIKINFLCRDSILAAPLLLDLCLLSDLAARAGRYGTQRFLSFFLKAPMHDYTKGEEAVNNLQP